jgi:hypothetical protein
VKFSGVNGVVKVGPNEAASFTSWSLVPLEESKGTYQFTGLVRAVDEFWITREPQELRVTLGASTLRWRGCSLSVAGDRVTAIVPRPEVLK